jgi:hypothetical protein
MASAKALAAALSWPRLAIVALGLTLLYLAAPARADEAVYIWRDATGAVRFSTVLQQSERKREPASDAPITSQRETRPGVALSSAKERGPY